jgi:flavin reductase (DIM6/NTAB) family NADH-FMN oxidoreductase RutF
MSPTPLERLSKGLDFPMVVVTAFDGGERSGCLVGFHTQCSIDPQRWLVCLSKKNHTFGVAAKARELVVHVLRDDQRGLAELFGGETADAIGVEQKFARCIWRESSGGTPILEGCDWFAGRIISRTDAGDHVAHVIEIDAYGIGHAPAPQLGFQAVTGMTPGHDP